jgi:hypothetical protein
MESAIAAYPAHKTQAWQILSAEEKSQIKALKERETDALPPKQPTTDEAELLNVGDRSTLETYLDE